MQETIRILHENHSALSEEGLTIIQFTIGTLQLTVFVFFWFIMIDNLHVTVQGYRILWTGMGTQLARDVPFSAICWSTLEPVRIYSLNLLILYHLFCV